MKKGLKILSTAALVGLLSFSATGCQKELTSDKDLQKAYEVLKTADETMGNEYSGVLTGYSLQDWERTKIRGEFIVGEDYMYLFSASTTNGTTEKFEAYCTGTKEGDDVETKCYDLIAKEVTGDITGFATFMYGIGMHKAILEQYPTFDDLKKDMEDNATDDVLLTVIKDGSTYTIKSEGGEGTDYSLYQFTYNKKGMKSVDIEMKNQSNFIKTSIEYKKVTKTLPTAEELATYKEDL